MNTLTVLRAQTRNFFSKFVKNEQGVTAIEYAIVAAGVGAIVLVVFNSTDGPVYDMITTIFATLKSKIVGLIQ